MTEQVKKQNTYTSEFRESAVKLSIETAQPISQATKELDQQVFEAR